MDPSTIDASSFRVARGEAAVTGAVSYDEDRRTASFVPDQRLGLLGGYQATIDGAVTSADGVALGADATWSFTVRDGQWSEPEPLGDGYETPRLAVGAGGDALAAWVFDEDSWASAFDGEAWGAAAEVEDYTTSYAVGPEVAIDGEGRGYVVGHQFDGTRDNVWANRWVDQAWGGPGRIETVNTGGALWPQVDVDAAGNAMAVWMQTDGAQYDVWYNRYLIGDGWGTAGKVQVNAADEAFPHLAVDPAGGAIVVFDREGEVMANRFVLSDEPSWSGAIEIDGDTSGGSSKLAIDAGGAAVVVWTHFNGAHNELWWNRFVPGAGWAAAMPVEGPQDPVLRPAIAIGGDGAAMVVFTQDDGSRYYVWATRFDGAWSEPELIEAGTGGEARSPEIAADPHGHAIAVWQQSDGVRDDIWWNRYVAGAGWGEPARLETDDADAAEPQIGFDGEGRAIALWIQAGQAVAATFR
jgi:hypothetical protein